MRSTIVLFVLFVFGFGFFNTYANMEKVSVKNIKDAIIGETTASEKYAAYSKKAKEEGLNNIAALFAAASKSESIHANNHRAVLEQMGVKMEDFKPQFTVKSTKENLQDALKGETYEVEKMYPAFMKTAKSENLSLGLISLNYAFMTEKKHQALYKNAIDKLNAGKEKEISGNYTVCLTCGNTYDGEAPARCGISMTPKDRFINIKI